MVGVLEGMAGADQAALKMAKRDKKKPRIERTASSTLTIKHFFKPQPLSEKLGTASSASESGSCESVESGPEDRSSGTKAAGIAYGSDSSETSKCIEDGIASNHFTRFGRNEDNLADLSHTEKNQVVPMETEKISENSARGKPGTAKVSVQKEQLSSEEQNHFVSNNGSEGKLVEDEDGLSDLDAELEECLREESFMKPRNRKKTQDAEAMPPRRSVRLVYSKGNKEEDALDEDILAPLLRGNATKKKPRMKIADLVKEREVQETVKAQIEDFRRQTKALEKENPDGSEVTADDEAMQAVMDRADELLRKEQDDNRSYQERVIFFARDQRPLPPSHLVSEFLLSKRGVRHPAVRFARSKLQNISEDEVYTGSWLPEPEFLRMLCMSSPCPASLCVLLVKVCAFGSSNRAGGTANRAYQCLNTILNLDDGRVDGSSLGKARENLCEPFLKLNIITQLLVQHGALLDTDDMNSNVEFFECCRNRLARFESQSGEPDPVQLNTMIGICCQMIACPVGQKLLGALPVSVVRELLEMYDETSWQSACNEVAFQIVGVTHIREQQTELLSGLFSTYSARLAELRCRVCLLYLRKWYRGSSPSSADALQPETGLTVTSLEETLAEVTRMVNSIPKLSEDVDLRWVSTIIFLTKLCRIEHINEELRPILTRKMVDMKSSLTRFASPDAFQSKIMISTLLTALQIINGSTRDVQTTLEESRFALPT